MIYTIILILSLVGGIAEILLLPVSAYFCPLFFVVNYILLNLLFALFLIISSLMLKCEMPIEKENRFCRTVVSLGIDWLVDFFHIKLVIKNKEILPKDTTFVLVQNHRSVFDPLVTYSAFRKENIKISFLTKPEVFKIPSVKNLAGNCYFLPIKRDNAREAVKTILAASKYIKDYKINMGIYPEGTRNHGDELLEFKHGAFKMAQKGDCDILVTAIRNTDKVARNFLFKPTVVELSVIGIIDKSEVKESSTVKLAEMTYDMIKKELEKR